MKVVTAAVSWRGRAGSLAVASMLLLVQGCGGTQEASSGASNVTPTAPRPFAASASGEDSHDAVVSRVPRRLLERFPILRSQPEGVPENVRDVVRSPSLGMSLDLAQRIPVRVAGTYWLVPARGYLCVMHYGSLGIPAAGMNCAPVADAVANGVANVAIGPEALGSNRRVRLIVGMAPRGARKVFVHTRGSTASAPVEHEVFVLRDSVIAPPDAITSR